MTANTKIEWCDHTFNPWIGCTKVSPGCDHCYAERQDRFRHWTPEGWGGPRKRTKTWGDPQKWNAQHEAFFAQHGRRQRVFCASLADVFDNEVPAEWRHDLFRLILDTPHLDWLLLTKRIGNVPKMLAADQWEHLGNVWLGATIVNQEEADRDIPKLLATPAAVRFLSMEPLLGPVDLTDLVKKEGSCEHHFSALDCDVDPADDEWNGAIVDWVIVGGESGPNARPMHPDWARGLRDQCAAAGVPFHFKQWGEWTPGENVERVRGTVDTALLFDDEWQIRPLNLATDAGHIDDQPDLYRVGKKAAGRLLDGVTHDGFPECSQ